MKQNKLLHILYVIKTLTFFRQMKILIKTIRKPGLTAGTGMLRPERMDFLNNVDMAMLPDSFIIGLSIPIH
ncbi:MAG: hypothetical protein RQ743_09580 [Bacteroidales bacterium]|nr:hypothetical protein [Bacteroidales bacterium]